MRDIYFAKLKCCAFKMQLDTDPSNPGNWSIVWAIISADFSTRNS